jgi:serine protease AprX
MESLSGFPFLAMPFDKNGAVVNRADVETLLTYLAAQQQAGTPVTDLILLSHGWNNDINDARQLYAGLLVHARAVLDAGHAPGLTARNLAFLGVLWPSKKFADSDLIPGNAAAFGGGEIPREYLEAQIDNLIDAVDDPARALLLTQAKSLLIRLEDDPNARMAFADSVRMAALPRSTVTLTGDNAPNDDAEQTFLTTPGGDLFDALSQPTFAPPVIDNTDDMNTGDGAAFSGGSGGIEGGGDGNVEGGAAGLLNIFSGITAAARNILNLTTFYMMKARTGVIGQNGVYTTLREVTAANPGLNLHLIGHSFGARLVTAVAQGPDGGAPLPVRSLTLLQAAFSHGGFSDNFDSKGHAGGFRGVIAQGRIQGPIVITYTGNDKVVGLAYPLACRLAGDDAAGYGGPDDLFGGLGRNGAQHTPEASSDKMLPIGQNYAFRAGAVHNLNSDPYIKGHSDLQHDEVAQAFLHAIQAGSAATGSPSAPSAPPAAPNAPPTIITPQTADEGGATGFDPPDSMGGDAEEGGAASLNTLKASGFASALTSALTASAPASSTANRSGFDQANLDATVIAIPLLKEMGAELGSIERRMTLRRRREDTASMPLTPQEEAELATPLSTATLPTLYDVIIDVNLNYTGGSAVGNLAAAAHDSDVAVRPDSPMPISSRDRAKDRIRQLLKEVMNDRSIAVRQTLEQGIDEEKSRLSSQYLFGRLEAEVICELVRRDGRPDPQAQPDKKNTSRATPGHRAIYRIWNDFEIGALLTQSLSTVKANAAQVAFGALGRNIVWAVMDSGIDGAHRHFDQYNNLDVPAPLEHTDFSGGVAPPNATREQREKLALTDTFGHGTHVAGIIAGTLSDPPIASKNGVGSPAANTKSDANGESATPGNSADAANAQARPAVPKDQTIIAISRHRDDSGTITYEHVHIDRISGMAPECKLLSLKVLDGAGKGKASNIMAAISYVQEINGYGRRIQIHGVNLSVGYGFEPEWFACGQSPLCVEVDRLVRSGVVVVIAAGNTGYGYTNTMDRGAVAAGLPLSINDPGNADLAITVGSTHREMPHIYGVSYFSSKGPTGDGRDKPDLVAPGEKILSCAAGQRLLDVRAKMGDQNFVCDYVEESGTSMAAPHVSGVIAAFLSVRQEYIGRPEEVKQIFCSTATDLKRGRHFQGNGLVDLMRAIQSV